MADHSGVLLLIKGAFVLGAVVVVLIFVVRPMVRVLSAQPNLDALMPSFQIPDEEELQIPTGGKAVKASRDQIIKELRSDPRRTATLVQQLLRDKGKDSAGGAARMGAGPKKSPAEETDDES